MRGGWADMSPGWLIALHYFATDPEYAVRTWRYRLVGIAKFTDLLAYGSDDSFRLTAAGRRYLAAHPNPAPPSSPVTQPTKEPQP